MKFSNNLLSVKEVKNTDIVDYLSTLGFKPSKVSRNDYWYISPFRDEKTPSFKVNRNLNRWYDFGDGKGGNLVDFGVQFHQCTVADFLRKMKSSFSFQQQSNPAKKE
ncbi:MAG TPA: CHC2 zinc finger domain-containing protein, partial [Chitinophagaceae bacterium]